MTKKPNPTPRAPLPFLGLACAVGVSTMYYNQPLLEEMGRTYHADAGHTGFVATATQVGYALGLLFFVPLGDVVERRGLMMKLYAAVAIGLVLVSLSPTLGWLILGSVVIGGLAAVTHVVLPIAPDLVSHEERGRAIGTVMTGLLLGILLARTFAGWLSHVTGWRNVFVVAAVMNGVFVPLLWRVMPKLPPKQKLSYGDAMRSLWTLFKTQPLLRESGTVGGLVFASFSCFWTTLVFVLESHYHLGAGVAGTFGLVGAAGALVAPVAGKLADKHGSRWVISLGVVLLAFSYVWLWAGEWVHASLAMHMVLLSVGIIVLDVGAQLCQVANQTRIFGLVPSARGRLNTVYMVMYFTGAAAGSALATRAWAHWQWTGVSVLELVLVGLAALCHAMGRRNAGEDHCHPTREDELMEA
ncbi:MFS transporter [Edaphobacter flagellatus]|uniref:MFS transporter n=1 Tax=Edaphobacter flagellatus TaxID=1933044 RepID=UPI0021B21AAA|nr:MFS transporter [Edaphobacter flagellatus]